MYRELSSVFHLSVDIDTVYKHFLNVRMGFSCFLQVYVYIYVNVYVYICECIYTLEHTHIYIYIYSTAIPRYDLIGHILWDCLADVGAMMFV